MAEMPKFKPMPGATGFIHHVDEAPAYWMQGILWTMLADAEDTGGRWSMMEQLLPQGSGPPPHKHLWSDETFYILDGTITFLIEDELRDRDERARLSTWRATHATRSESTARPPGASMAIRQPAWRRWSPNSVDAPINGRSHRRGRWRPEDRCLTRCSPATAYSGSTSQTLFRHVVTKQRKTEGRARLRHRPGGKRCHQPPSS